MVLYLPPKGTFDQALDDLIAPGAQAGGRRFYRRMRARLGGAAALVATAHKLARIVYAVISPRRPYQAELHANAEQRRLARFLHQLRSKAQKLGFELTSIQQPA
jgi:hypothetical protein